MPRYYFEIFDDDRGYRDEEGSEHADDQSARGNAVDTLTSLDKDRLMDGDRRVFTAEVLDQDGKPVFHGTLSFRGRWLR